MAPKSDDFGYGRVLLQRVRCAENYIMTHHRLTLGFGPAVCCLFSVALAADAPLPTKVEFNRDVRPILSDNCFYCHGPDANHRKGDLRLDERAAAIEAKAIVPNNASKSGLIARILSDDPDEQMPPKDSNKKLTARQKEILKLWVKQGAEYQRHWSYEPPVKAPIPAGQNGVDVLVQKRLTQVGLKSSPEADPRTLIRRLHADLIGLPPTAAEVEQFVAASAQSPEAAYDALIDRLLKSPHFGERMAIGWLDVVRFADTIGYHSDVPRNVWPYRDWVIKSFNDNKRFDRFTLEQIAGDLLPDASTETRVGSAFNRLLLSTEEGGAQPKDYEARMVTDRVRAIGTAWLGQTTGCAQCHDHKFDPITMRDFYSLGAFFADIQEPIVGTREPGMLVALGADAERLAKLDDAVAQAKTKDEKAAASRNRKAFTDSLPKCLVSSSNAKPRVVRILPRGNWQDESGEIMQPALPAFLTERSGKSTASASSDAAAAKKLTRLDLAQWIVSRDNPLTARTVMNRLWKQFFGTGLSKVLDDLGAQGEPPVNGELLDWLAVEFMESGWDMQHMIRVIAKSRTYRQSSVMTPQLLAADPYNREHARQSAFRMDAELVRDGALKVSGLLVEKIGGPSVKPYQPAGYWDNLNFPTRQYVSDSGEQQYRRGLYIWWQRTFLHPSMLAFDAPSREECCAERSRSNIPQQALVLLNDPTYLEAARAFGARVLTEGGSSTDERITFAWKTALQRAPRADELNVARGLLEQHLAAYRANPEAASSLLQVGLKPASEQLDRAELAAWSHLARVLLNLHEAITRS